MEMSDLLKGIVVESTTTSYTGPLFYSDQLFYSDDRDDLTWQPRWWRPQPVLNELSRILVIGMAAGILRMALAIIHTIGHLAAALVTFDKGHLYHAAKGGCEFLRGFIEALPYVGRKFAQHYVENGNWWIIKIYNPNTPDSLDLHADKWNYLKSNRPTGYVLA